MNTEDPHEELTPSLTEAEREAAEERTALRAAVVHEAIAAEGQAELRRPVTALSWSGLAAGLSMGFSLVAEGLLQTYLPDARWRPLVSKLGYSMGFLIVIVGRQQLFTENTLTVILPLLSRRDLKTLLLVLRLWAIVLACNLAGACAFAWVIAHTATFHSDVRQSFAEIGRLAMEGGWTTIFLRGVFAGWLIAMMVWMLPAAEGARPAIIIIMTYIVALGGFSHVIAGSVEALYVVTSGIASWRDYFAGYLAPTLLGNVVGGVSMVAFFNHAQVVADDGG
jgi:formate/nitrite transporter FocA (FNT family)